MIVKYIKMEKNQQCGKNNLGVYHINEFNEFL